MPESLGNLTALTKLDLSENQLAAVPESLGNLTALTTLDLSGNQLASVPGVAGEPDRPHHAGPEREPADRGARAAGWISWMAALS